MAVLRPLATAGKVNGLSRPPVHLPGRRVHLPERHPNALIVLGTGLYGLALLFPLILRQVTPAVAAVAFAGTAFLLWGLHVRWTRTRSASG